jgi:tetratricopeptide (TPR) repeat protein
MVELGERLRLMFFGNLRQGWSEFVLADLGIYRYEKVEFSAASRAFRSRADVDDYLRLQRCRERFEQGGSLAEVVASLPQRLDNPWIEARRGKLIFRIAQQHERLGELQQALQVYADCRHAGARARRIRVLERCERIDEALQLATQASEQPESEAERQQLLRVLPRLRRKAGLPASPRRQPLALQRLDLHLELPQVPSSVEFVVRDHLTQPDAPVHYVENTLIGSLFGLLCWPALFAALPGAFFHPFHAAPADLLDADFVRRRQALFDGCLGLLESDAYRQRIRETFVAKFGLQSPFVAWGLLDETLLDQALQCIPADHLKRCFERILLDIGTNRSGLPDLIQFWPNERRYRMIEVKGPGDRLQDNQIRWLDYCLAHGLPVAVCHVQWLED